MEESYHGINACPRKKNKTWEIVQKPNEKIPIVKYKVNGSIENYKARLVAKGYT